MNNVSLTESEQACAKRLESVGASPAFIRNFLRLHSLVAKGVTGIIPDDSIEPVKEMPSLEALEANPKYKELGLQGISKLAVCKLNGGLGTSMGLKQAKSLLRVRHDEKMGRRLSFNEVNARQIGSLSKEPIPFVNMVSFSTSKDVTEDLERSELNSSQKLFLQQNIHPKIFADSLMPAQHSDDALCWNPPGHGDFFEAFFASGMLEKFLAQGKQYLFVSNADNLSASPNLSILGYALSKNVPFLCEVTRRTVADRKGGHLARRKSDGRLILREAAQAPTGANGEIEGDFQNIERHRCFNINSIWIDLIALKRIVTENAGNLPLALIRNAKTLDPRDLNSPPVFQIETAIGAAIELFEGAELLEVRRERFAPVKTTSDLLLVLSDCFELDEKAVLTPQVNPLPTVTLSKEYRLIDDFEAMLPQVPSLKLAKSFSIVGKIKISSQLKIIGDVLITDLRSDRSAAFIVPSEHKVFENVKVSVFDNELKIEALA